MAKPIRNTERINIFLPPKLLEELKEEAKEKGINVSALIRMILLDRNKKE
jgi:predicted DNA binding CopG/RHH family protein